MFSGRGNSKCKSPEVGACLAGWRNRKEVSESGEERMRVWWEVRKRGGQRMGHAGTLGIGGILCFVFYVV